MLIAVSFGELLRTHRTAAGFTQAQLAERAGLSEQAISTLERGTRRRPRADTLRTLASALGLAPEERTRLEYAAAGSSATQVSEPPSTTQPIARQPSVAPRQLPPTLPDFVGRGPELEVLNRLLTPSAATGNPIPMIAVIGMGGIGKTALTLHAGHLAAGAYPDGQLYLDLRGFGSDSPMKPIDAVGQLLRSFGATVPEGLDEATALYRSVLAGRRVMVVLDNARDTQQVAPLLPGCPGAAVMVTSRRSLTDLPGFRQISIGGFAEAEALQLLAEVSGEARLGAERQAALEAIRLAAGLPLAIRLIGARLAARPNWPFSHIVEQLRDEHHRLDALGMDRRGVRANIAVSAELLSGSDDPIDRAASRVLTFLGLLDGPDFSTSVCARLVDEPDFVVGAGLERLVDLSLLESTAPRRYRFHDLIRVYAREQALQHLPVGEQESALSRVVQLYTAVAWHGHRSTHPTSHRLALATVRPASTVEFADPSACLAWLDEERSNIADRLAQAAELLGGRAVPELTLALFGYYETRWRWPDMRAATSLACAVAMKSDQPAVHAWLEHDRAIPEVEQGNLNAARLHLERSLRLFRSVADQDGEARCCTSLSHVLERLGLLDEALRWARQALALTEEIDDEPVRGISHLAIGVLQQRLGQYDEAADSFRLTFAMAEASGNPHSLAKRLQAAADAYLVSGQPFRAMPILTRALDLYHHSGNETGAAGCFWQLATACRARRDNASAAGHLQNCLDLTRKYGDKQREGDVLAALGSISITNGDRSVAIRYWTEAAAVWHDVAPKRWAAIQEVIDQTRSPLGAHRPAYPSIDDHGFHVPSWGAS